MLRLKKNQKHKKYRQFSSAEKRRVLSMNNNWEVFGVPGHPPRTAEVPSSRAPKPQMLT